MPENQGNQRPRCLSSLPLSLWLFPQNTLHTKKKKKKEMDEKASQCMCRPLGAQQGPLLWIALSEQVAVRRCRGRGKTHPGHRQD